jgi:DNA-binding NtrC family response regulator
VGAEEVAALQGESLVGRSPAWRRVVRQAAKVAPTACSVVLRGETGTGKERVARAIHATSARSGGPFVAVNCGAVPEGLVHAELFGHIRGAFTGAERNRRGLVERAHRGTLFLDEVADMPAGMQVVLLRVLEEGLIRPVGSARPRRVDVRVVAATHQDLGGEVRSGRFREDLYHRLAVVTLRLPALRDRPGDLGLLAHHLLRRAAPGKSLHAAALGALARHPWPGNVRELDNVLRAAALLVDGPEVTPEVLDRLLAERSRQSRRPAPPSSLGPRATRILEALASRWRTAADLAAHLSVSNRTVNREIRRLLDRGLVEAHGRARARSYRRAPPR